MFITYPVFGRVEFCVFVENAVEDHQNHEGWVVTNNSLGARKLSFINNIEPGGKEKNPGSAIKYCLQW